VKIFEGLVRLFSPKEENSPVRELGRNDICWCGSGKKYKKCHLIEDEKKANKNYGLNCGKS